MTLFRRSIVRGKGLVLCKIARNVHVNDIINAFVNIKCCKIYLGFYLTFIFSVTHKPKVSERARFESRAGQFGRCP